jgi:hypothetical protein
VAGGRREEILRAEIQGFEGARIQDAKSRYLRISILNGDAAIHNIV